MGKREGALENIVIDSSFWRGKKVLITGHTGFKGSWLSLWLQSMGVNVIGYAHEPPTKPSLFEVGRIGDGMASIIGDVRDLTCLKEVFSEHRPEIVFHMAAQSLVRYSYDNPIETYATNVMGTVNLLEAVRQSGDVKVVVNVTSDKCYENREWAWGYRENEPMGGYDPYSSSKGCSELVTGAYRNSYFNRDTYKQHGVAVASARAGNVIGGGDWALDRLIPDIMRAFQVEESVKIRNPHAIRPWQHVLEPLAGYLTLAEHLYLHGATFAEGWNFGPEAKDSQSVQWIINRLATLWGDGARWELDSNPNPHEANYLKLDCSKAMSDLTWFPRWNLEQTLNKVVTWYRGQLEGKDMREMTLAQIGEYNNS